MVLRACPLLCTKKWKNCSVHAWRTQAAQTTFLNSSVVRKLTHGIGQQPESNPGWKKNNNDIEFRRPKNKKKKQNTNDSWYMGEKRKQRGTMLSMASQFLSFSPLLFTCWTWPQTPKNVNYPAKKNTHVAPSCTHHRSNSPWTHTKPVSPHNQEAMSLPTQSSFQQTDFLVKFHLLTNPFDGK